MWWYTYGEYFDDDTRELKIFENLTLSVYI